MLTEGYSKQIPDSPFFLCVSYYTDIYYEWKGVQKIQNLYTVNWMNRLSCQQTRARCVCVCVNTRVFACFLSGKNKKQKQNTPFSLK